MILDVPHQETQLPVGDQELDQAQIVAQDGVGHGISTIRVVDVELGAALEQPSQIRHQPCLISILT